MLTRAAQSSAIRRRSCRSQACYLGTPNGIRTRRPPRLRALLSVTGGRSCPLCSRGHPQVLTRQHSRRLPARRRKASTRPPAKPHGIVSLALAALIDGGFSIVDAVASATAVAARACGLAQVTGRLEGGLAADLLLVDGNLEVESPRRLASSHRAVPALDAGDRPLQTLDRVPSPLGGLWVLPDMRHRRRSPPPRPPSTFAALGCQANHPHWG